MKGILAGVGLMVIVACGYMIYLKKTGAQPFWKRNGETPTSPGEQGSEEGAIAELL